MPGPLPRVRAWLYEDVLPPALFRPLLRLAQALPARGLEAALQRSWWYRLDAPTEGPVEAAVAAVLARLPPRQRGEARGAEWWFSRMRTSRVLMDFHRDRDNGRFAATGATVHPPLSTVLYLTTCRGGALALTQAPPDDDSPAMAPVGVRYALVQPRPNLLVAFPGTVTHGVLDARGGVPGPALPREPRLRLALAINLWPRRPWGLTSHTDSLADR